MRSGPYTAPSHGKATEVKALRGPGIQQDEANKFCFQKQVLSIEI